VTRATGWDPIEADWWAQTAAALTASGKPWPDGAILADLRWWAARCRVDGAQRPGRPTLAQRWGVTAYKAAEMMRCEDVWGDPSFPSAADRQNVSSSSAVRRQFDNGSTPTTADVSADSQQRVGSSSAVRQPTRVYTAQSTDTDHRTQGDPPTGTEPTSRPPDGSTDPSGTLPLPVVTPAIPAGPADAERRADVCREANPSAPSASVASSASAPRGGRAAPGGASGIPDDVLAAYAELDPERAASIRAGGHVGIASALAKAASKPTPRGGGVGSERLAARLRYIARNPGDPTVRAWRERTGGEVSQVLRGSNGWTVPIDARVDDLAASGRAVVAAPPKPAAPIPAPPRSTAREDFEGMVIRFSRTACTAWLERTGRYPVPGALPPESRHVLAAVGGWEALAEAAGGDPAEAVALLMRAWDARGGTE